MLKSKLFQETGTIPFFVSIKITTIRRIIRFHGLFLITIPEKNRPITEKYEYKFLIRKVVTKKCVLNQHIKTSKKSDTVRAQK